MKIKLSSKDKTLLLDLVILNAYTHFGSLSLEQEVRMEVLNNQLPGELNLEKIRKNRSNRDLDEQLKVLEDYIKNVLNYPYCGDMGMGHSRFMAVRYHNKHRFAGLAHEIKKSAVSMYVNLWRIVLGDLLPACSEERQSRLSVDSPNKKKDPRNTRPDIETRILNEKFPHFYELLADQAALEKCIEGLIKVAEVSDLPDVLEPTMQLHERFGIDSLEACELMTWYQDKFEFSRTDLHPKDDSLGEWARIIMTCRTI